ncbi:aldolase [Sporormia fimetaria CBS 119925]|uniref:Aldolase n=1 Tax=Sporormia fimetaria CBS 119925 TaxID=1340428 RepID=A0A6A6V2A1_9PLEO|nr:aldolase [Sporormia fimetaria CBS 119925]
MPSSVQQKKPFPPGIHGPAVTFFKEDERQEIDWETQERHLEFMVKSGLHGIVIGGSSGENSSLSAAERSQLVKLTRKIAEKNGRPDLTITQGCMAGCTRDVIDQTKAAHEAGADYVLVLVPAIFHWAQNADSIHEFFVEIADNSPLPVMIYNCPVIVGGIDLNSDQMEKLATHPNISGVKMTCANVGKMGRVAAQFTPEQYTIMAGSSDLLVSALIAGAVGCITGVANLFPKILVEIYNLYQDGKLAEAIELQKKLTKPEWGISHENINGLKWIIVKELGYPEGSEHSRRPFPKFTNVEKRQAMADSIKPIRSIEAALKPQL